VMLMERPTEQPTSTRCSQSLISKNDGANISILESFGED